MFNKIAKAEKKPYRMLKMYGHPHLCRIFLGFLPWSISHIYYSGLRDDYFEPIQPLSDGTFIKIEKILKTIPIAWKNRLKQ